MEYGKFIDGGRTYRIQTAKTPTPWKNLLFNDEYFTEVSQRLCGAGFAVQEYKRTPVLAGDKVFWVKIGDKAYHLCHGTGLTYSCEHHIHKTVLREEFEEFESEITVFVPESGKRELWQVKLTNRTAKSLTAEVFSCFEFANIEYLSLECEYDREKGYFCKSSFPYHITYDEYEKLKGTERKIYVMSSAEVKSFECSKQKFYGGDNPYSVPRMVELGRGTNEKCEYEDCVAGFHHEFVLGSLKAGAVCFVAGEAGTREEIDRIQANRPDFEQELKAAEKKWESYMNALQIDSGYDDLNWFVNCWLKKQMVYLARMNRGGVYCPVRNQLQDAMGYAVLDPEGAFELGLRVLRRQKENGYLKQWYMTDGSPDKGLCLIHHSDACVWLIICMTEIIELTGKLEYYGKKEAYSDSGLEETIYEHLRKGALYMASQIGSHGLCLMKDGDWTDPINGAGRKGRGESVWNTLALIYAIKKLCAVRFDEELDRIRASLTEAVNTYGWDGDRYLAGYDDEGIPFGSRAEEEASLFLNAQTWALIAGVCDEERIQILKRQIGTLKTDFGYLLLYPPFKSWNPRWGKISIKQKGTTENGSVYCHGNLFKAYADFLIGDREAAVATMRSILPTNERNGPDKNLQVPIFVPNYYFGCEGENLGHSSNVYSTGAAAWMLWLAKKYMNDGNK